MCCWHQHNYRYPILRFTLPAIQRHIFANTCGCGKKRELNSPVETIYDFIRKYNPMFLFFNCATQVHIIKYLCKYYQVLGTTMFKKTIAKRVKHDKSYNLANCIKQHNIRSSCVNIIVFIKQEKRNPFVCLRRNRLPLTYVNINNTYVYINVLLKVGFSISHKRTLFHY